MRGGCCRNVHSFKRRFGKSVESVPIGRSPVVPSSFVDSIPSGSLLVRSMVLLGIMADMKICREQEKLMLEKSRGF